MLGGILAAICDFGHVTYISNDYGSTAIEMTDPGNIGNDIKIIFMSRSRMKLEIGSTPTDIAVHCDSDRHLRTKVVAVKLEVHLI
jgi:hypothetical protein